MADAVRWRVVGSVDGATYRRLLALCDIHRVELADLVAYLLSVGLSLSVEDLQVVPPVELPPFLN